jgi:hypothetical protein
MTFQTLNDYIDEIGDSLEHRGFSDQEIDTYFLQHFGKKGMKWGVRRQRRTNALLNVAKGKGTKSEKVRAALTVNAYDLVRGRGLKGAAKIKGEAQRASQNRIKSGNAKVRDRIRQVGGTKYQDIFPTGKSSKNTKAAVGASVAGAIVVGQLGGMALRSIQKSG